MLACLIEYMHDTKQDDNSEQRGASLSCNLLSTRQDSNLLWTEEVRSLSCGQKVTREASAPRHQAA